ncbi:serine O-acetyltransferase [Paucidesulfovibrio longus]|uniref:serine O-acetyltransferase n=1 Tax=Paucidesulfovibrio longus TaxID=889 RepID=UPI0003B5AC72|nr:serine O-acetyltransferase [Paucidesulfovibrio longus]
MLETFREDLRAHREGLLAQGFWALTVYRFGHRRFRYSSWWVRKPWGALHLVLHKLCEIFFGISLHCRAEIGRRVQIEHFGGIIVHGNAVIGDDCLLRQGVSIGNKRPDRPLDAPRLGNGVNVGAGAKILGAVSVGDGAVVGANAVVLRDVPPRCLAVGVPAQVRPLDRTEEAEGAEEPEAGEHDAATRKAGPA